MTRLISLLSEHNVNAETLYQLLEQGLEMERMNLQLSESIPNSNSVESFVKLMEGERLLSLLTAARFSQHID